MKEFMEFEINTLKFYSQQLSTLNYDYFIGFKKVLFQLKAHILVLQDSIYQLFNHTNVLSISQVIHSLKFHKKSVFYYNKIDITTQEHMLPIRNQLIQPPRSLLIYSKASNLYVKQIVNDTISTLLSFVIYNNDMFFHQSIYKDAYFLTKFIKQTFFLCIL